MVEAENSEDQVEMYTERGKHSNTSEKTAYEQNKTGRDTGMWTVFNFSAPCFIQLCQYIFHTAAVIWWLKQ